jgi:hypothetical protein
VKAPQCPLFRKFGQIPAEKVHRSPIKLSLGVAQTFNPSQSAFELSLISEVNYCTL